MTSDEIDLLYTYDNDDDLTKSKTSARFIYLL